MSMCILGFCLFGFGVFLFLCGFFLFVFLKFFWGGGVFVLLLLFWFFKFYLFPHVPLYKAYNISQVMGQEIAHWLEEKIDVEGGTCLYWPL